MVFVFCLSKNQHIMGLKDIVNKIKDKIVKEKEVLEGEESKDKFFYSQQEFPNEANAKSEFERSKRKLFDVNQWSNLPGVTSSFQLFKPSGEIKFTDNPEVGDYIKILLPGPMPENWVKVIDVEEGIDSAEFTVSPSPKPKSKGKSEETDHFFTSDATSTFRVNRKGNIIFGYEIGKDESINNQGEEAAGREWINTLIAQGGWLGFQKVQWEKLTDFLVHLIEIEEESKED
jgi:hypothetical protein